jgi:polygalacturonase
LYRFWEVVVFNVKDFGAVGDGVTYDDAAFTRALDAIAALSTGSSAAGDVDGPFTPGPILFIPRGTYRLSRITDPVGPILFIPR